MNLNSLYVYTQNEFKLTIYQYITIINKIKNIMIDLFKNNYVYCDLKPDNIFLDTPIISPIPSKIKINVRLGDMGGLKKIKSKKNVDIYGSPEELMTTYSIPKTISDRKINVLNSMIWEYIILCILLDPTIKESIKTFIKEISHWNNIITDKKHVMEKLGKICAIENEIFLVFCTELLKYTDMENIETNFVYTPKQFIARYNEIFDSIYIYFSDTKKTDIDHKVKFYFTK